MNRQVIPMNQRLFNFFLLFSTALLLSSCDIGSGGSSSTTGGNSSGVLQVRGTIEKEQADAAGKREPFPGYAVCAFGTCGTTDAKGEFLFSVVPPQGAAGIEFTVSGPAFSLIIGFPLKQGASVVDATLLKPDDENELEIGLVAFDGVVDSSISPAGFNDGD